MEFFRSKFNRGSYEYDDSNSLRIYLLGMFFTSDVGFRTSGVRRWALDDEALGFSGNITFLEKEDGYIYLSDLYSEEDDTTRLKMSLQQFLTLLDDWDSIIKLAHRPERLMIIYANDQFSIEAVN